MTLTRIFTRQTTWIALTIGLIAGLTVVHLSDFSAKAALSTIEPLPMQGAPAGCGASFAQAPGSPVGTEKFPAAVAVGDFNLDSKPDLAIANFKSDNVTIALGNGEGGFVQASGSPIGVGAKPFSVAVGDFNLDGKPDLAVANSDSDSVTILLGNGVGGFTQPAGSPVGVGSVPSSVAVGDFNLDGRPDLVVAGSTNLTILLGNGSGGFSQAAGSPVSAGTNAAYVVVEDFNLDSKPDLAVANSISAKLTVLLGNGSGGFSQAAGSPISVGNAPVSLAVGDFSLDGKPDLAVANYFSNNVMILLGNGGGGFTQAAGSPIAVGFGPNSLVVGDLNLDGRPDLAVANLLSNNVTTLLGNGSGGFAQAVGSPISAGSNPYFIAIGDFNLDSKPDLAVANDRSNIVMVLLNTCYAQPCTGIAFSQPAGSPVGAGNSAQSVAMGDFNLDGKPDLAVANFLSLSVTILLGNGSGGFTQPAGSPVGVGASPYSVAVGDFNLDGKPDIATANNGSGSVTTLLGNGSGGFTQAAGSGVRVGNYFVDVAVGDFNIDGKPDLVAADAYDNGVTILLGNGSGGFTQPAGSPVHVGGEPSSVAVGDFNLDGKPDLAVANYGVHKVTILLGNGNGSFTQPAGSFGTGSSPYSIAVGDINLDGKPDVITANYSSNDVTILLGNGSGGFTQAAGSPVGVGIAPFSVAVGDFNLDGKPDLAVANGFSDNVTILLGNGSGGFTQPAGSPVGVGSTPFSVAVDDFNLDGKPDLAVANRNSRNVTIQLNTCTPPSNTSPTISAAPVKRIAGSSSANSQIAKVGDAQDALNTLSVKVNGGASATVNGVTVSNITVDAAGVVRADAVAAANATNASFTLRVTDGGGLFAEATLNVTVVGLSVKLSDPAVCLGPGGGVGVTAQVGNPNATQATATFTATPDANLRALAGTCTASLGTCSVNANTNQVEWNGVLGAGQSVTINYRAQVADAAPVGADLCVTSTASLNAGQTVSVTACTKANCPPVGPGVVPQAGSPMSDGRPGSVLIYNLYTSAATGGEAQNTRIAITNTHLQQAAFVHLFFVAESCSVADSFLCLTPNQTATFLASDLDPGTSGYIVAVATDPRGCPANFNFLIGDEFVKLASGHATNLGAEAIAAIAGGLPVCDSNSVTAQLSFDGLSYAPVPRALALSNLASRADGNDTLLVLNRIGGNLGIGASTLGSIFGILYDDAEHGLSFSFSGNCQLRSSINNNFPRTAPRFEQFVPAGRSGWMRLYSQSDVGITGAAINFNANAASTAGAFNQGHNLHTLTLATAASYVIPVFPPNC